MSVSHVSVLTFSAAWVCYCFDCFEAGWCGAHVERAAVFGGAAGGARSEGRGAGQSVELGAGSWMHAGAVSGAAAVHSPCFHLVGVDWSYAVRAAGAGCGWFELAIRVVGLVAVGADARELFPW